MAGAARFDKHLKLDGLRIDSSRVGGKYFAERIEATKEDKAQMKAWRAANIDELHAEFEKAGGEQDRAAQIARRVRQKMRGRGAAGGVKLTIEARRRRRTAEEKGSRTMHTRISSRSGLEARLRRRKGRASGVVRGQAEELRSDAPEHFR